MEGWRDANQAPLWSSIAVSDGRLFPSDLAGLTTVWAHELVGKAFVRGRARMRDRARLFSLVVPILSHGMAPEREFSANFEIGKSLVAAIFEFPPARCGLGSAKSGRQERADPSV